MSTFSGSFTVIGTGDGIRYRDVKSMNILLSEQRSDEFARLVQEATGVEKAEAEKVRHAKQCLQYEVIILIFLGGPDHNLFAFRFASFRARSFQAKHDIFKMALSLAGGECLHCAPLLLGWLCRQVRRNCTGNSALW